MGMLLALLKQRCPRCRQGKIFHGVMTMYEECSVCGLVYRREYGYFYGAMYASYAFGLISTGYWLPMLLMGVNPVWIIGLPTIQLVLQIPLSFRYSRTIWLYLDHSFDPEAAMATEPQPETNKLQATTR